MPHIEFEVWCSCGNGLCNQATEVRGGISIQPCEKCLEDEYNRGYRDGYDDRDSEE